METEISAARWAMWLGKDFTFLWHTSDLSKFGLDFHSSSVPNVSINFSEVKVTVQGQNHRTENIPLAIAQLSFKIFSRNLAV